MGTDLHSLFLTLASFSPPRRSLKDAPWDAYVPWAIAQGLGPLAAYNLEYRLAGAHAPEWARDQLLSIYQGSANDNVMKLVNFKRSIDELTGARVLLHGGASFAEALYPHVAFRPLLKIELVCPASDVAGLSAHLKPSGFAPAPSEGPGTACLFDGRTRIEILAVPAHDLAWFDRLWSEASPRGVYGPSVRSPSLEDAIVLHARALATEGFSVPMVYWIDARELVLGAPSVAGHYSRPPEPARVFAQADARGLSRALFAMTATTAALFPETAEAAERLIPPLRAATRRLLERAVVRPLATEVGRTRELKGASRLRKLLLGGLRLAAEA